MKIERLLNNSHQRETINSKIGKVVKVKRVSNIRIRMSTLMFITLIQNLRCFANMQILNAGTLGHQREPSNSFSINLPFCIFIRKYAKTEWLF